MARYLILSITILFSCNALGNTTQDYISQKELCKNVVSTWMKEYLVLIKNTVGYSPPVAGRTMNYIGIGNYEAVVEIMTDNLTLSGQLNGYDRKAWNTENKILFYPQIVNSLNYQLAIFFFENMPPYNKKQVEKLFKDKTSQFASSVDKEVLQNSEIYSRAISEEIIKWSQLDGGDKCWNRNFPPTYTAPACIGCWTNTLPSFKPALLPYWGKNKLMLQSNGMVCTDIPTLTFSTDSTSEFYAENYKVYQLYKNISKEQETIAEYWNDAPGVSGTPIGHLQSVAQSLAREKNLTLEKLVELYALLGIATNDAFIECWRLKYHHTLLRPIVYIQSYIDSDFKTVIETPPFPEFPSGHSFQSGSGSEILKHIFTDQISFTDSANIKRTDIIGTPRKYSSITSMAEEMSISRFYGGIHYPKTLEISLQYGQLIGKNTINNLKFHK